MTHHNNKPFAAIVGIDWADQKHDICVVEPSSGQIRYSVLPHRPEAIERWARELRQRYHGQPVAVALEQSRGPLIHALLKYDFLVLYPVDPNMLAQYRKTFAGSRAKDDPVDAFLLTELVSRHRERLRPWRPDEPTTRKLEQLVLMRRRLVDDRKRLTNRLIANLKGYYPQLLEWFDELASPLALDFLLAWPNLEAAQDAAEDDLLAFFRAHNSRRRAVLERRIQAIRSAMPLTEDAALVEPHVLLTQSVARQLKLLLEQIGRFDAAIEQLTQQHQDYGWISSLPGAGPVFRSRLITAFGTDRSRYKSADELLCYAGIAPVTERSGKKCWVHWRWCCPTFLRQTFVEWSAETIRHSAWARAFYQLQRERGKSHQQAVRALAFKWIRILFRLWQDRQPYDETTYINALRQRRSPLLKYMAEAAWQ